VVFAVQSGLGLTVVLAAVKQTCTWEPTSGTGERMRTT
jgi:hypothetical protein